METEKILKVLEQINEKNEYNAAEKAARIIEAIAREHEAIAEHQSKIAELRNCLKSLSVVILDTKDVLGE